MTWIANQRDGNFYYIDDINNVGVCFIDCLGMLSSVIGENCRVSIRATAPPHLSDVFLSKAYGGDDMWKISEDLVYTTNIVQLSMGIKKNYILELEIPPGVKEFTDLQKHVSLVEVVCEIDPIIAGHGGYKSACAMEIILLN